MNIRSDNIIHRKTHTCMILADGEVGSALAPEIGALLSGYDIKTTLDTRPDGGIPWGGVDTSEAQYPDYKRISDADPEYILVLSLTNGYNPIAKALPYHAEHCTGSPKRDTTASRKACNDLYKALKGIGCTQGPTVGTRKIEWKEVEDFPNLNQGDQVFLNLDMDVPQGYESQIAKAIASGVAAYFGR